MLFNILLFIFFLFEFTHIVRTSASEIAFCDSYETGNCLDCTAALRQHLVQLFSIFEAGESCEVLALYEGCSTNYMKRAIAKWCPYTYREYCETPYMTKYWKSEHVKKSTSNDLLNEAIKEIIKEVNHTDCNHMLFEYGCASQSRIFNTKDLVHYCPFTYYGQCIHNNIYKKKYDKILPDNINLKDLQIKVFNLCTFMDELTRPVEDDDDDDLTVDTTKPSTTTPIPTNPTTTTKTSSTIETGTSSTTETETSPTTETETSPTTETETSSTTETETSSTTETETSSTTETETSSTTETETSSTTETETNLETETTTTTRGPAFPIMTTFEGTTTVTRSIRYEEHIPFPVDM